MKILIAGHSFIRWYRTFLLQQLGINTESIEFNFADKLGLPLEEVYITGKGGLKCDKQGISFIINAVHRLKPDIILLDLGTNDISNSCCRTNVQVADSAANSIFGFCRSLWNDYGVRKVILFKIVNRRVLRGNLTVEDFNERKHRYHQKLCTLANPYRSNLLIIQHDRSVIRNLCQGLTNDDIHLTSQRGLDLYHFGVRRSLTRCLQSLRSTTD